MRVTHSTPLTDLAAFSIQQFCKWVGISRSHFYALKRRGEGPDTIKLGRRRLISRMAAEIWLRTQEAANG